MKRQVPAVFAAALFLSAGVHAEAIYKWMDEQGGVHYGESPPQGVKAKPVDTRPQGVLENFGTCSGAKCADAGSAPPPAEAAAPPAPPAPAAPPPREVRGMSFSVYTKIQKGMTEGEVLQRAGDPDLESVEGTEETSIGMRTSRRDRRGGGIGVENTTTFVVKTYTYLPTTTDPFTTVITFSGGRVTNIERIRKL